MTLLSWSHIKDIYNSLFGRITIFISTVLAIAPVISISTHVGLDFVAQAFFYKILGSLVFITSNVGYILLCPTDIKEHSHRHKFVESVEKMSTDSEVQEFFDRCVREGHFEGKVWENTPKSHIASKYWDLSNEEGFRYRTVLAVLMSASLILFYFKDLIFLSSILIKYLSNS